MYRVQNKHTAHPAPHSGVTWNVRVVFSGDRYGLDDCLTHDDVRPLVEIYDAKHQGNPDFPPFMARGQFVSRYYLEDFQGVAGWLSLDGGIPRWTMDDGAVRDAQAYVATTVAARALGGE